MVLHYRYNEGSIKDCTRSGCDKDSNRVYTLQTTTKLPPQKVILSVSANKKQLIDLINDDLVSKKDVLTNKLFITGSNPVPTEIDSGVIIKRFDMRITHEEADTMIIHHIIHAGIPNVLVIADDTDVFILLCHFIFHGDIQSSVKMLSPIKGRAMIDVNRTVDQNRPVMENLLAAHGLTGCDTVATFYGVGKAAALKVLKTSVHSLDKIGDVSSPLSDVTEQAFKFLQGLLSTS